MQSCLRDGADIHAARSEMPCAPAQPTRANTYTLVQIALHWLVVALVFEQYATSGAITRTHSMHLIGWRPSPTDLVLHSMHNRFGLFLTVLMVGRLAYRLWAGAPPLAVDRMARIWVSRAASLAHASFYIVLICEGIAGAVASYLWWPASTLHVALFKALLALVIIHVAAVAFHHLTGTAVLRRMGVRWVPAFKAAGIVRAEIRPWEGRP